MQYLPQHSSCQSTGIHLTRGQDNSGDLYRNYPSVETLDQGIQLLP